MMVIIMTSREGLVARRDLMTAQETIRALRRNPTSLMVEFKGGS
jgi:hypothetical protein